MLISLHIKSYPPFSDVHLTFARGLSVITGESGSGKSLFLNALQFLLGQTPKKVHNTDLEVSGVFDLKNNDILKLRLEELNLDLSNEKTISLRRKTSHKTNKTISFINETPISQKALISLSDELAQIISQFSLQKLLHEGKHQELLDKTVDPKAKQEYEDGLKKHRKLLTSLQSECERLTQNHQDLDFLEFKLDRLTKLNPVQDEYDHLIELCNTQEQITLKSEIVTQLLEELNAEHGLIIKLKNIKKLAKTNGLLSEQSELDLALQYLQDYSFELENKLNPETFEITLQDLQERISLYQKELRYFKAESVEELILLQKKIASDLNNLSSSKEKIIELYTKICQSSKNLERFSQNLSKARLDAKNKLEHALNENLNQLGLHNITLECTLTHNYPKKLPAPKSLALILEENKKNFDDLQEWTSLGLEKILITRKNSLESIAKSTSGGELARIYLLYCAYLSKKSSFQNTLCFDEIDTGTSAYSAQLVANKLQELSKHQQVFIISHSPQVIGASDHFISIQKDPESNNLSSVIKNLTSEKEKTAELAKYLSGKNISKESLDNAQYIRKQYNHQIASNLSAE